MSRHLDQLKPASHKRLLKQTGSLFILSSSPPPSFHWAALLRQLQAAASAYGAGHLVNVSGICKIVCIRLIANSHTSLLNCFFLCHLEAAETSLKLTYNKVGLQVMTA